MFGRGPSFGAPAPPSPSLPASQLLFLQTREAPFPFFSTACPLFSSLLHPRAMPIPFPFSRLCTLCAKHPGVTMSSSVAVDCQLSAVNFLSSLESALTDKHRVLPCFGRTGSFVSPAFPALTDTSPLSPLESALTKIVGEGGTARRLLPRTRPGRSAQEALWTRLAETSARKLLPCRMRPPKFSAMV